MQLISLMNNRSLIRSAQFFHDLDLPPFQNKISSACCKQSIKSKSIKIVSDKLVLSIDNGKRWKAIYGYHLARISGIPSTLDTVHVEDVWNSGWEIFYLIKVVFLVVLACENCDCIIKPNRFCYYVQKGGGFRENLASVIVFIFLIFYFVDQLLLVDVFSQLYYLNYAKKQRRTYRDKSLKSWKIDNIDLTQKLSLSISTEFRYQ